MNNSTLIQRQGMLKKRLIKDLPKKKKEKQEERLIRGKTDNQDPKQQIYFQ